MPRDSVETVSRFHLRLGELLLGVGQFLSFLRDTIEGSSRAIQVRDGVSYVGYLPER